MTPSFLCSNSGGRPVSVAGSVAVALLLVLTPGALEAQSLLGTGGLGIPSEALDARSRALGGVGVGLSGWQLLPNDPGSTGGLFLPSITLTMQPASVSVNGAESAGRTRFPVVAVSYPYRNVIFSVQFGSFLEQEWEARTERTIAIGDEQVLATDVFESKGGVGVARFGAGYRIIPTLAVGANVGTYIGALERRFIRELDPVAVGPDVEPYAIRGRWRSSGTTVAVGVAWDPSPLFRLGATVTHSGDLEMSPVGETAGEARKYPIPLEYRAGGTFSLTPGVALALGASYADWSETGAAMTDTETRAGTWTYGGGVELAGVSLRERRIPFRLGVREQQLPFHFQGAESSERSYSAGFGIHVADAEDVPVARFELSLERGSRSAGALSEEFWRTTLSIRLAGG